MGLGLGLDPAGLGLGLGLGLPGLGLGLGLSGLGLVLVSDSLVLITSLMLCRRLSSVVDVHCIIKCRPNQKCSRGDFADNGVDNYRNGPES